MNKASVVSPQQKSKITLPPLFLRVKISFLNITFKCKCLLSDLVDLGSNVLIQCEKMLVKIGLAIGRHLHYFFSKKVKIFYLKDYGCFCMLLIQIRFDCRHWNSSFFPLLTGTFCYLNLIVLNVSKILAAQDPEELLFCFPPLIVVCNFSVLKFLRIKALPQVCGFVIFFVFFFQYNGLVSEIA